MAQRYTERHAQPMLCLHTTESSAPAHYGGDSRHDPHFAACAQNSGGTGRFLQPAPGGERGGGRSGGAGARRGCGPQATWGEPGGRARARLASACYPRGCDYRRRWGVAWQVGTSALLLAPGAGRAAGLDGLALLPFAAPAPLPAVWAGLVAALAPAASLLPCRGRGLGIGGRRRAAAAALAGLLVPLPVLCAGTLSRGRVLACMATPAGV